MHRDLKCATWTNTRRTGRYPRHCNIVDVYKDNRISLQTSPCNSFRRGVEKFRLSPVMKQLMQVWNVTL